MKKTIYLTSLLALTACATGGGSGPSEPQPRFSDFDLGGNMADKIACKGEGAERQCFPIIMVNGQPQLASVAKLSPKMHSRESGLKGAPVNLDECEIFDATDIEMKMIVSPGNIDKQKFTVKDGKIDGLEWIVSTDTAQYLPAAMLEKMEYIGKNKFSFNSENVSGTAEYVNEADLNYSNFGVMKIESNIGNMNIPFAGGYGQTKEQTPGEKGLKHELVTYIGKSKGMVEYASGNNSEFLNISDDDATLVLDTTNGIKETFTANYVNTDNKDEQWHSLTVSKTNGASTTYTFSGSPNTDDKFTMNGNETHQDAAKIFETGYFNGNNGQPGEVVGLINYQERINPGDIKDNNRTMTVGFGMKAQQ